MALRFFGRARTDEQPEVAASGAESAPGGSDSDQPVPRRRRGGAGPLEPPQGDVMPTDFPEGEGARRRRRRRSRGGRAGEPAPAEAGATPETTETLETPAQAEGEATEPPPSRRRGRRRGSGAGAAAAEEAAVPVPPVAPAPTPRPAAVAPTRARPPAQGRKEPDVLETLQGLVARQNVTLDTFSTKQLSVLRSVERSIQMLSERVGGEMVPGSMSGAAPRVGIFVDVPNIMYAADRLGIAIDFEKLLRQLTRGRSLVRASAYAPISDDPQASIESQKFVAPFVHHGYRIVTKPLKRFADGSIKANFDVELAMDVLTMSDRLDVVSLVSGDGDFRRLCELIGSKGVRVEVVAFGQSTAAELRTVADEYVDLAEHLDDLTL